ncbi:YtxH domain-containing protein [Saccharibacillus sp. JS10]|uniref:YtxH domain-containing protein n=1 Tax=Saccharibacillus sp. JS10 TaxID=2950552 RepID=UPI002109A504|nr:YtxH domain-containing protein [Saccharibacillus sp. JS10]MCQ4086411.1 YtxH domain-containing protein [Saccharibacillus sp. JS10]
MDKSFVSTAVIGAAAGALIGAGTAVLVSTQKGEQIRLTVMDAVESLRASGPTINEHGHALVEKSQEVTGVVKETLGAVKELKEDTVSAARDVKSDVQDSMRTSGVGGKPTDGSAGSI